MKTFKTKKYHIVKPNMPQFGTEMGDTLRPRTSTNPFLHISQVSDSKYTTRVYDSKQLLLLFGNGK